MEAWQIILLACGGLGTIGGAVTAIKSWISPLTNLSKRVAAVEAHDKQDLTRFAALEKENQAILRALYALLGHELDGNGIESLKAARRSLWEHIIEK